MPCKTLTLIYVRRSVGKIFKSIENYIGKRATHLWKVCKLLTMEFLQFNFILIITKY